MSRKTHDQKGEVPPPGLATSDHGEVARPPEPSPDPGAAYKPKYPPLWENVVTISGMFLTGSAVLLLLTFALFSAVSPNRNPYVDVIGFLGLPSLLFLGVALMPIGILIKSWRVHRRRPEEHLAFSFPHIDLNDPAQRRVAKYAILGSFALLPLIGVSSYHGYHYTDSADFCAKACHAVMEPQATAYEHSAHARVPCAECHIGAGASWFVKSKLSGTRQVFATLRDTYPRPIPPAIANLRPARETCEECHWPAKFFGAQLREIVHFASDERNTRREVDMLLKTGGGDETTGRAMGIHMHMALAGRIKYVATDDKLQDIPWVEFTDKAGHKLIYRSDGRPTSDPRPQGEERTLDCMDCHNRPAHRFRSPQQAVDIYLETGRLDPTRGIDPTLPYIKQEAMKVLVRPYPDRETALLQIGSSISEAYRTNYPEVWGARTAAINQAIDKLREIYRNNFFPDMNVNWQTYADNIGHLISPGCFRCHDGRHANQYGDQLSHECNSCHVFLNPVDPSGDTSTTRAGEFIHSLELLGPHKELLCHQCHDGGVARSTTCSGCHAIQTDFRQGRLEAFRPFGVPADPMADVVDCDGCHDLNKPTNAEVIDEACLSCHEEEADKYRGMSASWKEEADKLIRAAESKADVEGRRLLDVLRKAGPLHNIEATRKICRALAGDAIVPEGRAIVPSTRPVE